MKIKTAFCLSLLALLFTSTAFPCINKSGTKYGGGSGSYFGSRSLQSSLDKDLNKDGVEMEANLRRSTNYNDRSDYAVALMFLGRGQEAVDLLKKLELEQPGHFFIAANLGTAYELTGNNAEALKWINEGIRRYPKDHEGTEWLHAKILEAKMAQEKDPAYFQTHSVLGLGPADIRGSVSVGGKQLSAGDLAVAIQYQLVERLQFVKPPDPAVASLLFDYAAIEAVTTSMESAKRILKMATDYGYPAAKVDALNADLDRRLANAELKTSALIGLVLISFVALLVFLYKRRIFVLSYRNLKGA